MAIELEVAEVVEGVLWVDGIHITVIGSWSVLAEGVLEFLYHPVGLQHRRGGVWVVALRVFVDLAVVAGEH